MKNMFNEGEIIESVFTEAVSPKDYGMIIADYKEDIIPELVRVLKKFGLYVYRSEYIEGGDTIGCIISRKKLAPKDLKQIDELEFHYAGDDDSK